jgi:hypothetical protein
MRNRRDALVLGVLLFSLTALALVLRAGAGEAAEDDPRHSTFRSAPMGARALLLVAQELGFGTRQRLTPFDTPPGDDVGLVVLLAPIEALTPREVGTVLGWVRSGGTLLYGAGGARLIADSLGLQRRSLAPDTLTPFQRPGWPGVPARTTDDPLAHDIGALPRFRTAFPDTAAPLLTGEARILATAEGAAVVILVPLGDGRVVAWSDPLPLTNRHLRDGSAALLFLRLATDVLAGSELIEFDEYHQGFRAGSPGAALRRFLATPAGTAVLQLALAGLALLLLAGHRFGAPYPVRPPRRRSPIEHVEALAGAYGRAGGRHTARRLLLAGLHRRLGRRVTGGREAGLPPGIETTPAGRRLKDVWERGEDADLVVLAQAVDDVVSEVRRWR